MASLFVSDREGSRAAMYPFTGLRLLLPAILPSWRFFDAVRASPRIDYALLAAGEEAPPPGEAGQLWRQFRPRPAVLTPGAMLRRLVWNPEWNEDLFLVSLSERLMTPTTPATEAHSERELLIRVARHLHRGGCCGPADRLCLRLSVVGRRPGEAAVEREVVHVTRPHAIAALIAA